MPIFQPVDSQTRFRGGQSRIGTRTQMLSSSQTRMRPGLLALVLTALLLGACGGGGSGGGSPVDNDTGGGDTGNTTTGGTTGTTTGGDTGTGTAGGTTGGTTVDNTDTGLSSVGNPVTSSGFSPDSLSLFDGSGSFASSAGRSQAQALPNDLGIVYESVENHGSDAFDQSGSPNCKTLGAGFNSCSIANLHIKDAAGALNDGDWKIYFHSIRRILRVDSDEFSVSLVNGDLNYLEPTDNFTPFDGSITTVGLVTEFSHLIESDFMPRYWLVRGDGSVTLINNTDEDTDESQYAVAITGDNAQAFNGEPIAIASAASRFTANSDVAATVASLDANVIQSRIVPKPSSTTLGTGTLDIGGGVSLAGLPIPSESIAALQARQAQFMSTSSGASIAATIDPSMASGSYELTVTTSGITMTAADEQSMFYAAQSLLALVQPGIGTIPAVTISDAPRFGFRGMHIDSARNFHSLDSMKRLMDQMAAYKLNKLHLHLSDDEGWRLQIPSLPELTDVGARRQFQLDSDGNITEAAGLMPQLGSGPGTNNQGTGFYSREQFIELLQYAADRYIDVIPEFDMPAHARAAVVSMRARAANLGRPGDTSIRIDDPADTSRYRTVQHYDDGIINPCLPGTYNFIGSVIDDVNDMYTSAGLSLDVWHMGGDEANNVFKGAGFQDINDGNKVPYKGDIDTSLFDFPWERSPACESFIASTPDVNSLTDLQPYFVKRVSQLVADAGIPRFYAYQDIYDNLSASELATDVAGVGFWEMVTSGGYNTINGFASRGFETIVAVPDYLYFDFPQEVNPEERGYYWATRSTGLRKVFSFAPENLPQNAETSVNREGNAWSATGEDPAQTFIGMQGQLWSETVRTAEQFDYMVFPRLLALAERAWHKADWELDYVQGRTFSASTNFVAQQALLDDYAAFAAALGTKEFRKLDTAGIQYRIPVPGASNTGGTLSINSEVPGLPLEFSLDGTNFSPLTASTPAAGVVAVRAKSGDGARAGRADAFP